MYAPGRKGACWSNVVASKDTREATKVQLLPRGASALGCGEMFTGSGGANLQVGECGRINLLQADADGQISRPMFCACLGITDAADEGRCLAVLR